MLARVAAFRTASRAFAAPARLYTVGRTEGSVAESKGFSKKEKAHEDQYIRKHEAEQLAKLKAQIAAKEAELQNLKDQHADLAKDAETK